MWRYYIIITEELLSLSFNFLYNWKIRAFIHCSTRISYTKVLPGLVQKLLLLFHHFNTKTFLRLSLQTFSSSDELCRPSLLSYKLLSYNSKNSDSNCSLAINFTIFIFHNMILFILYQVYLMINCSFLLSCKNFNNMYFCITCK